MWGSMPYITKDELCLILSDLPEYHVVGRSGRPATVPTAARVAYAHVDLNHLTECMPKEDQRKIKKKYRSLPDFYYQDNVEAMINPRRFDDLNKEVIQQPSKSHCAKLWEICSGSSSLSARARQKRVPHLPPIDLRYGWYTHTDGLTRRLCCMAFWWLECIASTQRQIVHCGAPQPLICQQKCCCSVGIKKSRDCNFWR